MFNFFIIDKQLRLKISLVIDHKRDAQPRLLQPCSMQLHKLKKNPNIHKNRRNFWRIDVIIISFNISNILSLCNLVTFS